jgi:hypothetical protein
MQDTFKASLLKKQSKHFLMREPQNPEYQKLARTSIGVARAFREVLTDVPYSSVPIHFI